MAPKDLTAALDRFVRAHHGPKARVEGGERCARIEVSSRNPCGETKIVGDALVARA
jgi:hypothetical protein